MKSRYCFPLLLCLTLFSLSCRAADSLLVFNASRGVLDLRNKDINQKSILLKGSWAFYWQQLVSPDSLPLAKKEYINFPGVWNNTIINGKALPAKGYATYALTVLLPSNSQPLAIKIPDVYSAYRLYINGKVISENGRPGTTASTTEPYWSNKVRSLPEYADTLHIVWQIANFAHSKGGTNETLTIGDKQKIIYQQDKTMVLDFLLTGCLFMAGFFFFGLYLFGRYDKALLFFSLFCIIHSYYIVGSDPYSLHRFIPNVSWWVTIRLEYTCLYLSTLFFILYIRNLYPEETHKKVIFTIAGVCSVLILLTMATPPFVFTKILPVFLIMMGFYILYVLFVFAGAALNKRTGSVYSLVSCIVIATVVSVVILDYFGLTNVGHNFITVGYLLFFLLQSLILSYRFAHSLKKAKRQAVKASMAKSQFLSTMSHEIRTPLNAVIGMAHLMLRNNPRKDQQEELEVMLFSANNLLSIVNDILDFNKIEAGKIHFECIETDMRDIVQKITGGLKTFAGEKGITLHVETDASLDVTVMADPTRTSQVLTNLVHNAIKFTSKGSITLSCMVEEENEEHITLKFSVKDTGIGIAPDKQRIIFDRFTQADSSTSRSFGGTGLGLSICKSILEKQNSKLCLESIEGEGSTFWFVQSFPVCKKIKTEVPVSVNEDAKNKPLHGSRILLVEDSELNILVATRFLQAWGAEIDIAQNGKEAIEKFNADTHNLILMDLHMPVMDGRDATIELRKLGAKVPIIALTASIYSNENKKVIDCGANDIVVKPFEPESLRNKLMQYLKTA